MLARATVVVLALGAVVALAIASCSSEPSAPPEPTPTPEPIVVVPLAPDEPPDIHYYRDAVRGVSCWVIDQGEWGTMSCMPDWTVPGWAHLFTNQGPGGSTIGGGSVP